MVRPPLIQKDRRTRLAPSPDLSAFAERWLDTHGRWHSTFESTIKFLGASWLATGFVSSLLLNAYLKVIGQRGIPLDLAGTWAMLALMGGMLVVVLAALAAMFVIGETIMKALHHGGAVPLRTRIGFFVAAASSLVVLFYIEIRLESPWTAAAIAFPTGLAAGLAVLSRPSWRLRRNGTWRSIASLVTWILVAALLFVVLATDLDVVLRIQFSGSTPLAFALGLSLLQMAVCTFLPRMWAYCLTLAGTIFVTLAVSPGPYVITLIALDATNQGGGLPAGPLVTQHAATICNLGTADRPLTYRVAEGCSKASAIVHLQEIVSATTSAEKAKVIAGWRCHLVGREWRAGSCHERLASARLENDRAPD